MDLGRSTARPVTRNERRAIIAYRVQPALISNRTQDCVRTERVRLKRQAVALRYSLFQMTRGDIPENVRIKDIHLADAEHCAALS